MKKIYIVGAFDGRAPWTERRQLVNELGALDEHLRMQLPPDEFKIIDFRDCGKGEAVVAPDLNSIGVEDFIRAADVVVAFCDPPSLGFGCVVGRVIEAEPQKIALGFFHRRPRYISLHGTNFILSRGRNNRTRFFMYETFGDISSKICRYSTCFDEAQKSEELTVPT